MDLRSPLITAQAANNAALTNAWQDANQHFKWKVEKQQSPASSAATGAVQPQPQPLPQQTAAGGVVATASILPVGNNSPSSQRRVQSASRSSREYSRSFSEDLNHHLDYDDPTSTATGPHNNAALALQEESVLDNKEGVEEEDEEEEAEQITIDIGTYQPTDETQDTSLADADMDTEPGAEGMSQQQQLQQQQQNEDQRRQEEILSQLQTEQQKQLKRSQRGRSDRMTGIPSVSASPNILTPASSSSSFASDFSSSSVASSTASVKLWSAQTATTNLQSLLIPSQHLTFVRYLISPGKRLKKQRLIPPSSSPSSQSQSILASAASSANSISTVSLCNYHGTLVVVKRFTVNNLSSSFLNGTFAAFIHHLANTAWVKPQTSLLEEDDLDHPRNAKNKKDQAVEYIRNERMIQLYGICLDPPDLSLVVEYAVNGCLYDYLHRAEENKRRTMTHRKAHVSFDIEPGMSPGSNEGSAALSLDSFDPLLAALQIAEGMMHLHAQSNYESHPITLKSSNIVLDEQFNAKICDLSEETYFRSRHSRHRVLTPFSAAWIAPEMLAGFKQTRAADVYAFGIILWELLTYRLPFVQVAARQLARHQQSQSHTRSSSHYYGSSRHSTSHDPQQPIAIGEGNGNGTQKQKVSIRETTDAKSALLATTTVGTGSSSSSIARSIGESSPTSSPSAHHSHSHSLSTNPPPPPSSSSSGYQPVLLRSLKLCQQHILLERLRPPIPRHCPSWLSRLLNQCWDESAEERPTFAVIVSFMQQQLKQQSRITIPLAAI